MTALQLVLSLAVVCVGGGLGAVARWGVQTAGTRMIAARGIENSEQLVPWLTFLVNVAACFLLGIVVARLGSATGAGGVATVFGFLAVVLAAVNIFGGFAVTERMLAMFKKRG